MIDEAKLAEIERAYELGEPWNEGHDLDRSADGVIRALIAEVRRLRLLESARRDLDEETLGYMGAYNPQFRK